MTQKLKRHHINELIGMIKLKGGIGYPIVYYANEVDAVVAKKDAKIGKLTDELSKTGGQIKRLADLAHVHNTELAQELKEHLFVPYSELREGDELKDVFTIAQSYYLKDEVDAVLAKKDAEIQTLKQKLMAYGNTNAFLTKENTDLKIIIESKDAEIRRLKRAMWLSRAGEAAKEVNYWNCENESSYAIVDFNVHHETIVSYKAPHHRPYKWILIWENVERKCRAKAEQYK